MQDQSIRAITVGPWEISVHQKEIKIADWEHRQLLQKAAEWATVFPREEATLAWQAFGVPSVLIRFDYIVEGDAIRIYEIEERPAGLAMTRIIDPHFRSIFAEWTAEVEQALGKRISIFVAPSRLETSDDMIIAQDNDHPFRTISSVRSDINGSDALFVRSYRNEREYYDLAERSLSTIKEEGYKGYGVQMGLWKKIDGTIDLDQAFALKPKYGSRCEEVYLYSGKRPGNGFSTKTKVLNAIESGAVSYVQPFHKPEEPDFLDSGHSMIRRVYLGFDPILNSFRCLGGMWMARKCVKVHGASDTISGVIHV